MKSYLLFNLSLFVCLMAFIATLFYVSSGTNEYTWAFLTMIWSGLMAESEWEKIKNPN